MQEPNPEFNKQYKYEEMSNKVLRNDRTRRRDDKDDSNPVSLAGQISVKDMGTRVSQEKTSDRPVIKEKDIPKQSNPNNYSYTGTLENISYHPTNEETAHIFDLIMVEIHNFLPDSSHDVIISAADSVLEILKQEDTPPAEKRKEITELLDTKINDIEFNGLINLAKRITDYDIQMISEDMDNEDNDQGIAVMFDNSDEEEDDGIEHNVAEEVEDDKQPEVSEEAENGLNDEAVIKTNDKPSKKETIVVPLHEIDQFYLQRKISSTLVDSDPSIIQQVTNKFVQFLSSYELSTRELENELMELMNYEHFDLIKFSIENRWRLVFKIKFLENESEESKQKILEDMAKLKLDSLILEFENQSEDATPGKKRKLSQDDDDESNKKTKTSIIKPKREPKIVDLDSMSFDQGSHLMTNTKIKLPQGSYQQNKKLYDVISIPPPSPPPSLEECNEKLVSISELPEWTRCVFPSSETSSLNRIQSKIFPLAFNSDENLLICAPTGAGKTNVAMLTILRAIHNYRDPETGQLDLRNFKIVYIAPLKALVQEQMREFQRRLTANFGIIVNELTGDSSLSKQQISETQVLVTTPEKWDVITRKSSDLSYTNLTRLIIIDEIHLLHDERGPVLESIISRTLRQVEYTNDPVRLVGLSATLPNYEDVANLLRVDFKKGLFYFDSSYRPCPLEQQFIGIKEKKAIKKLSAMNEACYDKLLDCANNKHQMIIFVHSRKDTYKTAKWLHEKLVQDDKLDAVLKLDSGSREILKLEAEEMDNRSLKEIVPAGFGIHHAGLNKRERSVVEDLFAQGHLQVLVSTATLAWGVNLPAHTVVIKGTETYSPERGTWVQLSPQDILQMLGRAGRPRYDKSGEGVIITSQDEIQYYLAILNQQLPIESQLMTKLADNLNAEIVLGTIKSREDAVNWLGYTYLYIRMLRSPALYHVGADYKDDENLYWKRVDLIHSALTILHENKLLVYNHENGDIKSTELGKISSHYYINYETINMYNNQLKPWLTEIDILKIFSMSGEFKFIPVRQEEKIEVAKLLEKCPFPIRENPNDRLAKVNVLLQAYISRLTLDGFALMADMIYITQSGGRLLRAIHEITLRKNWSALSKITLDLCKMVEKRMWLTNSPFRQFGALVPREIVKASENSHLPWVSYFNLNASELAEAINFKGNSQKAYDLLRQFPKLTLNTYAQPITASLLRVQLEVIPDWKWNPSIHGNFELFWLLVEDCGGEKILFSDYLRIYRNNAEKEHLVEFTIPILDPVEPVYFITLINEKWLHSAWRVPLVITDMKIPKKFPPFTDLLDLQSIPTASLKIPEFIETFEFSYFNKFQSQVFQALFNSNENVFIGASKGCGKTVCAELAILKHWKQNKGRIVYINPTQEIIDKQLKIWRKIYSKITEPSKVINKLSGDLTTDIGLLSSSHLVLATPEQFEFVSRRWRQRKSVQAIELLINDDAHMVGNGSRGIAYEILVARMRLISTQVENGLRIIALSNSLSNGRDFGEWIGCTKQNVFNFDPSNRFNKIKEIRLQASNFNDNDSFMQSLIRPSYQFLKDNTKEGKSIVFVPTRKQCIETAFKYIQHSSNDNWSLLRTDLEILEPYLKRITDKSLTECLSRGIGLYYNNMSQTDKLIIEKLFNNNVLSILIASKDTCYYCPSANNIVVLSTQEFEGKEHRFIDYSINNILEMVGCCKDDVNEAKSLIFTNSAKLNYYNKFLNEALPIESFLNVCLPDAFITEVSTRTFKTRQDCIDWLTFTYFYRRLLANPSFYDVKDTSHLGISEFLSVLVESTLKELEEAKIIEIEESEDSEESGEEEEEIVPLNGAMISAYYNVSFNTVKEFNRLGNKTKLKGILEIITSASEFDVLPIRQNEEAILSKVHNKVPVKASDVDYESPYFKAFLLLQAHFSRIPLPLDLANDQKVVLESALKILYACIDTLSSEGYLNAIHAMDLSQMIVQAVWNRDNPLKQVPYFDEAILNRCKKGKVETVYDIMSLEDEERNDILRLGDDKLNKVAEFVNQYPNIDISYELDLSETVKSNEPKEIIIKLERDEDMDDLNVVAPFYPFPKKESWWIVIGDASSRQLYAIKKATIDKESQRIKMEFTIPNAGHHNLSIWCMCDSYVDADKETSLEIEVEEGEEGEEAEADDENEEEE